MNRLFLALEPSSLVRRAIADWQPKPHEKLDRQGMRWAKSDKYHVTLLFLGDLPVEQVKEEAEELVGKATAPRLHIGRLTGLPDNKRPGVLALEVSDSTGSLAPLQTSLQIALLGTEDEYTPHLILSRMKPASTKLGHKLRDYIHSGEHPEDLEWTPEAATLFNSLPDGSYELIARFEFKRV
ncbi:MAG: RNA 2',3'-cyclic phosphodiesterase [Armatimonadota bacterium]